MLEVDPYLGLVSPGSHTSERSDFNLIWTLKQRASNSPGSKDGPLIESEASFSIQPLSDLWKRLRTEPEPEPEPVQLELELGSLYALLCSINQTPKKKKRTKMGKISIPYWNMAGIMADSDGFWRENADAGFATVVVVVIICVWQFLRLIPARRFRSVSERPKTDKVSSTGNSRARISGIVTDEDLKNLIANLEGKFDGEEKWEHVIDKRNNFISYNAKCCKPKDGPLKYLSLTVFENCSTELLRDFYLDNNYRKKWDKTLVKHEQLQVDDISGTEIGHTIKKFPFLTPREYVLAWRLWEGDEKTFYCFIKECDHALVPQQKKYVRVKYFRSGWRIRKVPDRDACEIKMVYQEDAGLNVGMAKLAFAKGIWSYVCKMDVALRRYTPVSGDASTSDVTALAYIQKVPSEINIMSNTMQPVLEGGAVTQDNKGKKLLRRPSKKVIANSLLIVGGIVYLSQGHSFLALGAKIAMAGIFKKLSKRGAASKNQVGTSTVTG